MLISPPDIFLEYLVARCNKAAPNSIEYLKRFLGYDYKVFVLLGAGDRDRTGMALRSRDDFKFEK